MSNNFLLEKDFNKVIITNIFSSLIQSEKWDMLLEMFKLNIIDINTRDSNKKNALYWAINKNKIEIIKELISLNISSEISPNLSAINYAVYLDSIKIIKCLKNCGLNIDEKDSINSTPLISAILFNKQNSIKYLIENGADLEHEDFLGHSAKSLANTLKIKI